jgi:hypothetical protein
MSVEKELADIMLGALTTDLKEELGDTNVPLSDQIRAIKTYINTLPIPARVQIAKIVTANGYKSLYKSTLEGVTLNLDNLPAYVISDIYEQIISQKQ